MLMPALCFSQPYKQGDYVEVDGIPAVVIKATDEGSHGVMMTCPIIFKKEKQVQKLLKKKEIPQCLADKFLSGALPYCGKPEKLEKKVDKEKIVAFYKSLTLDGMENAKLYRQFCEENNIDMASYFPKQYVVAKMGNGWYIPGASDMPNFVGFLLKDMTNMILNGELPNDEIIDLENGFFRYKHQSTYRDYIKDFLKEHSFIIPLKLLTSTYVVSKKDQYAQAILTYGGKGTSWWYRVVPAYGNTLQNYSWAILGQVTGKGYVLGEFEKFKFNKATGAVEFNGFGAGNLATVAFKKF